MTSVTTEITRHARPPSPTTNEQGTRQQDPRLCVQTKMSVNPNAMYSRSDWAQLPITDRIKAMNDTLDSFEGEEELSFDFSSRRGAPQQQQQQQQEQQPEQPTGRSSVVDMWRRRDSSSSLGTPKEKPASRSSHLSSGQAMSRPIGSAPDPSLLAPRPDVITEVPSQEEPEEQSVPKRSVVDTWRKQSAPGTAESSSSSVSGAPVEAKDSEIDSKPNSRPPTPRSAGRQVVVMPWDVPGDNDEKKDDDEQQTIRPFTPESIECKPRLQKLSSGKEKSDLVIAPAAAEATSPIVAPEPKSDRWARQKSLSNIANAAEDASTEVPTRSGIVDLWNKRAAAKDNAAPAVDDTVDKTSTVSEPPKLASFPGHFSHFVQTTESPMAPKPEPAVATPSSTKSTRVIDRWMKRQDSLRMEKEKEENAQTQKAARSSSEVSPVAKRSPFAPAARTPPPPSPFAGAKNLPFADSNPKAPSSESKTEVGPSSPKVSPVVVKKIVPAVPSPKAPPIVATRSTATPSLQPPLVVKRSPPASPKPKILPSVPVVSEKPAEPTVETKGIGTPPLSPKASDAYKYNSHSPRLMHWEVSSPGTGSPNRGTIDVQHSPKAHDVARKLNDLSPKASQAKVDSLKKLSQPELSHSPLASVKPASKVPPPSQLAPKAAQPVSSPPASSSASKFSDRKPQIPKGPAVPVTRGKVASRWLDRSAAADTDKPVPVEPPHAAFEHQGPGKSQEHVPWPTNDTPVGRKPVTEHPVSASSPRAKGFDVWLKNGSAGPSALTDVTSKARPPPEKVSRQLDMTVAIGVEASPMPISPTRAPSSPESLRLPKATRASPTAVASPTASEASSSSQRFNHFSNSSAFAQVQKADPASPAQPVSSPRAAAFPAQSSPIMTVKPTEGERISEKMNKRKNRLQQQRMKMRAALNAQRVADDTAQPTIPAHKSPHASPAKSAFDQFNCGVQPAQEEAALSDVAANDAKCALPSIHSTLSNLSICSSTISRTSSLTEKAEKLLQERRQYKLRSSPSKQASVSPSKAPSVSMKNARTSQSTSPRKQRQSSPRVAIRPSDRAHEEQPAADVVRDMFGAKNRYETESRLIGSAEDFVLNSRASFGTEDAPSLENTSFNNRSGTTSMEQSQDTSIASGVSSATSGSVDERSSFLPFEKEALDALENSKIASDKFHVQNASNFDAFANAFSSVTFGDIAKDMAREMNKFTSEVFNYGPQVPHEKPRVKAVRRIEDVPFDEAQEDTAIEVEYIPHPTKQASVRRVVPPSVDESAWNAESTNWPESFKRTSSRKK